MHAKYGLQQSTMEKFIAENETDPDVASQLKRLQELIQNPESSFPCEIPEGETDTLSKFWFFFCVNNVFSPGLSKDNLLEIFEKILVITAELLEECVKKVVVD